MMQKTRKSKKSKSVYKILKVQLLPLFCQNSTLPSLQQMCSEGINKHTSKKEKILKTEQI